MAHEKKVEAGAFVVDLEGGKGPRVLPSPLANAYSNIGAADRVVLLLSKSGAGYYCPLAAARLQDVPEDLRWQVVGVADGRPEHGGIPAVALAPLGRERSTVRYLLVHAGHSFVPEDLRRPLAGDQTTGHVTVGYGAHDAFRDYAELNIQRFEEDDEKVMYQLDATPAPQVPENIVFPAWVEVSRVICLDAAAFARGPGTPFADKAQFGKNGAAGLGLGALDPSGLVFVRNDAETSVEKLLGNNEHGAPYSDGGRPSPHAAQVLVEPPVGAKAGDPIPLGPGANVARADAGYQDGCHGGGNNLSAVVGILAASSAVTAVATGDVNPIVAFGSFLVLLGGVVAAMAGVRDP